MSWTGTSCPTSPSAPLVLEACRRSTSLPLDVHLMIDSPERYLEVFAKAGATGLTIHAEATPHLHGALETIRRAGLKAGLAVNPLTPLGVVREALPQLDLVLVMSVNPGFGGQRFIPATFARMARVREWRDDLNPDCSIEIDGGIDLSNIGEVARAGADILVAGSAVFNDHGTIAGNLALLRKQLGSS